MMLDTFYLNPENTEFSFFLTRSLIQHVQKYDIRIHQIIVMVQQFYSSVMFW